MHGVNLDLLRILPHHLDGRSKDAHSHHRAEHLAALGAIRRAQRQAAFARFITTIARWTQALRSKARSSH